MNTPPTNFEPLPEYEHQDELADPDEWSAWSEIPRVQNDLAHGAAGGEKTTPEKLTDK